MHRGQLRVQTCRLEEIDSLTFPLVDDPLYCLIQSLHLHPLCFSVFLWRTVRRFIWQWHTMTKTPVVINQIQPVFTFRVFLFFPTSLSCPRILEIQNDEKLSQVHLGEDLQSEKLSFSWIQFSFLYIVPTKIVTWRSNKYICIMIYINIYCNKLFMVITVHLEQNSWNSYTSVFTFHAQQHCFYSKKLIVDYSKDTVKPTNLATLL